MIWEEKFPEIFYSHHSMRLWADSSRQRPNDSIQASTPRVRGPEVDTGTKEKRGANPHPSHVGAALSPGKACQGNDPRAFRKGFEGVRVPAKVGRSQKIASCSGSVGAEELVSRDVSQVVAEATAKVQKPCIRSKFSSNMPTPKEERE
jgi:hypothetical protein